MTKKFELKLINDENLLRNNRFVLSLYKVILSGISVSCILCGLIPEFLSFQRIFYTGDSSLFLVLYLTLLSFFIINCFGFIYISFSHKVFVKRRTPFIILLIYLGILLLFSLDAYLFTGFKLTGNGYEVPFNVSMYIIDLFILFPICGFFEYCLVKFVTKRLIAK